MAMSTSLRLAAFVMLGLIVAMLVCPFAKEGAPLVLVGVVVVTWLYSEQPHVQVERELEEIVRQGDQMRRDIQAATENVKAEMDRIARMHRNRSE